ncbi:MAG: hypothetical protein RI842_04950 [Schleiferiaceae bacterium]|nr:hypothetical protein [Schleiferiaceae bacterium]
MDYLLLGIGAALAATLLRRLAPWFYHLARTSVGLLDIYLQPGSEDDKLPQIEKGTQKLLFSLLRVIGALLLALVLGALLPYLYTLLPLFSPPFAPQEGWAILAVSLGATLPFLWPARKPASGYPPLAQLLHHLALDHPHLGRRLLRGEVKQAGRQGLARREDFLIITGLARAGTTSFLNALLPRGPFASLHYGHMPFLLSPRRWARLYRPRGEAERERSHGDGVRIGLKSSEALEEYFWQSQPGTKYIWPEGLKEYALSNDQYREYLDYQRVVRRRPEEIYVAKNNNFLLRYRSLRARNPHFRTVILFRAPLYQAASLREKHRQYRALQGEDPFVETYMSWLGHYEFGRQQRPFLFPDTPAAVQKVLAEGDREGLDYWLAVWIAVYGFAAELEHEQTYFVAYEDFCARPEAVLGAVLAGWTGAEGGAAVAPHQNSRAVAERPSSALLERAEKIYEKLREKRTSGL